jgi:hypothetical protein
MSRAEWLFGVVAIAGAVSCSGAASKGNADGGPDGEAGGANGSPDGGPDGAAGGGSGNTVLARFFAPSLVYPVLAPCDAEGGCADGQRCFRLAAELAVCDVAAHPVLTVCLESGVDQCACGGPDCPAGTTCSGVALTAHFQAECLPNPCASAEECPSGSVCTPTQLIGLSRPPVGRCLTPTCTSDADCTGGVDGRCALVMTALPPGGGYPLLDKVGCVFAGLATNATACAPEQATSLSAPNSSTRYYTCAGR